LFELGLLYGLRRPFVVFRHRRWGPPFNELDLVASDLKGVMIKSFDHERDEHGFRAMLKAELARCDEQFVANLGGHLVIPTGNQNLLSLNEWTFEVPADAEKSDEKLTLRSFKYAELAVLRHISPTSLFVVTFHLDRADSAATAYLNVRRLRGESREASIWV